MEEVIKSLYDIEDELDSKISDLAYLVINKIKNNEYPQEHIDLLFERLYNRLVNEISDNLF